MKKTRKLLSIVCAAAMLATTVSQAVTAFADSSVETVFHLNPDSISQNLDEVTSNGGYWNDIKRGSWSYGHIYNVTDPDDSNNKVMALDNKWGGGASTYAQKTVGYNALEATMTEFKIRMPEVGVANGGLPYVSYVSADLLGGGKRMRNIDIVGNTEGYQLVSYTSGKYYENGYEALTSLLPKTWYKIQCINIPQKTGDDVTGMTSNYIVTNLKTNESVKVSKTHPFVKESDGVIADYANADLFFLMEVQGADGSYKSRTTQVLIDDYKIIKPLGGEYKISLSKTADVGAKEAINIICDRDIDTSTVLAENISMKKQGSTDEVDISLSVKDGKTIEITPNEILQPAATYVVSVPGVKDVFGMTSSSTATFTTEARTNIPFTWSIAPTSDVSAANAAVTLSFVEEMDQSTFTTSAIKVVDSNKEVVPFTITNKSAHGLVLNFAALEKSETYTISLPSVTDVNGYTTIVQHQFTTELKEFETLLPDLTGDATEFNERYTYKASARSGICGAVKDPDDTSSDTFAVGAYHWYGGTSNGSGQIGTVFGGTKPFVMDFNLKIKQDRDFYLTNGSIQIGNIANASSLGAYTDILQAVPVIESGETVPSKYDLTVRIGSSQTLRIATIEPDKYYSIQIAVEPKISQNAYSGMDVNYYINGEQITSFYNIVGDNYASTVSFPDWKLNGITPETLGVIFQATSANRPAERANGIDAAMYMKDFSIVSANKAGAYTVTPYEDVESYEPFTLSFDRVINKNTVSADNVKFYDSQNNEIEVASATYKDAHTLRFRLAKTLEAGSTYRVCPAGIKDMYYMASDESKSITTLEMMEDPDLRINRTWWSDNPIPSCSNEVTDVIKGKDMYCKVNYANTSDDAKTVYQITALYDNNYMIAVQAVPVDIAANGVKEQITSVSVPDTEGDYTLKTFIWTNLSDMKPINNVVSLPVE